YGPSMLPTLNIYGDYLLLDKISPRIQKLSIGDLIVFTSPADPHITACKRIIGMPGNTICINPTSPPEYREYLKLPKGRVWVQGDNGTNSTDSRVYGPLPMGLIKAKVLFRAFPVFTDFRCNIDELMEAPEDQRIKENLREVDLEYLMGVEP
ncbi:LexA/Signal peptidase, partial [Neoconidiobolus thromboides FSU 785]